jgi:mono/diheme cytochrome c family protein
MIDTVAAALLTAMVGTGYILWFALPPGTNRTHILWGLLRHQWGTLHFWISVTLLAVLAIHVALHWRWLVTSLSKRFGMAAWAERSPRLAGLTILATAALPLTTLALAAHLSVRPMDAPLHPLIDAPRTEAAPTTPGMAAEQAAQTSPVLTQGTTPPAGFALSTSPGASITARDAVVARAAAVLAERCASCHGVRESAAGIRADTLDALCKEHDGVRWITPGRPDASRLFEVVGMQSAAGGFAPKHRLSQREDDALRAWIASLYDCTTPD